jgi:hypothetical protein|nr:MAG TPA: hypothetical protein [Bacteriophage sp.]
MIIAIVSLFVLVFIEMITIGYLQERIVRLEKVALALSMTTQLDKFVKGLRDEE